MTLAPTSALPEWTAIAGIAFGIASVMGTVAGFAIGMRYQQRNFDASAYAAISTAQGHLGTALRSINKGECSVASMLLDLSAACAREQLWKLGTRLGLRAAEEATSLLINTFNNAYRGYYEVRKTGDGVYDIYDFRKREFVQQGERYGFLALPPADLADVPVETPIVPPQFTVVMPVGDIPSSPPPRRLLGAIDGRFTALDSLYERLQEAHQMSFVNPDKMSLLLGIASSLSVLLKSSDLSAADRQTIQNELIPQISAESLSIFAYNVDTYGIDKVVSSLFLAVDTSSINTWTNNNHWKSKSYFTNPSFFDPTKVTILAQPSNGRTRYVNLVGEDTQYNGASIDAVKDIVSLLPVGNRTYNINTSNGDDVVLLDYSLATGVGSTVNLLGGSGHDTFIIKVKNGLSNLQGKITILDFNANEDKIIFDTGDDNYLKPTIKQTWRGSILDTVQVQEYGNGTVQLYSSTANWWEWNKFSRGRLDTFEGTGIPMVEVWSQVSGQALADTKLTQRGVIQTTSSGYDLSSGVITQALLLPSNTYQSTYSQFEQANDYDCFRVGVTAGNFYRFRILSSGATGDTKVHLGLQKQMANLAMANIPLDTKETNANDYQIGFVALTDEPYYLYAASNGSATVGKYEIQYKEVKPTSSFANTQNVVQGHFQDNSDYQVFTANLTAGQYLEFTDYGRTTDLSVLDSKGERIYPWLRSVTGQTRGTLDNSYRFLANEAGKYYVVLDDKIKNSVQDFRVALVSDFDIENTIDTQADLKAGVTIQNRLETVGDRDWFRVQLGANQKYQFDLNKVGNTNLDTYIRLRDANGNLLGKDRMNRDAFNDDVSIWNYDSKLIYEIASTGTYYVDVSAYRDSYSGNYTLTYKVI